MEFQGALAPGTMTGHFVTRKVVFRTDAFKTWLRNKVDDEFPVYVWFGDHPTFELETPAMFDSTSRVFTGGKNLSLMLTCKFYCMFSHVLEHTHTSKHVHMCTHIYSDVALSWLFLYVKAFFVCTWWKS